MKKIRLRNPYTFQLEAKDVEHPKGKSLTIANEALTIKEILEKWTHGVDPMMTKNPEFLEDAEHEDPDMNQVFNLDITDRAELSAEAAETFEKVKQTKKKSEKEKQKPTQEGGENGE